MPLLLSLETSSPVCSVALSQDNHFIGFSELRLAKSHSSHITVLIKELLYNTGFTEKDLSAVAISGGPGSYTGLRIGTSTAKGLCYALDIPLISVSTLHAMAKTVIDFTPNPENYLFCPMLDARRMEVYTSLLTATLEERLPVAPLILEEDSFKECQEENKIIYFGSGAQKWQEFSAPNPNALFLKNVIPTAQAIAMLAWPKLETGNLENVAYYDPFYLKEVHITKPVIK
jgi:tRNA threonylcarbamoyladenosine biosynthesis protein TsaB